MMRINLTDNNIGQPKAGEFLRKDVAALFPIADRTMAELCMENENLLIFPYSIANPIVRRFDAVREDEQVLILHT